MCPDTRSSTCASIVRCLQLLLQLFSQLSSIVVLILLPAYDFAYYYICVRILLYVSAYYYISSFLILLYICSHTTTSVSSYYYICVLILLHLCPHTTTSVSSYYYICVLILLYMCPHATIYVSSYYSIWVCCYICRQHMSKYQSTGKANRRNPASALSGTNDPTNDPSFQPLPIFGGSFLKTLIRHMSSYCYVCPHTAIYVSSYYYICVYVFSGARVM